VLQAVSRCGLSDELLEVDREVQRSLLGLQVWADVVGLVDSPESAVVVVGKEDEQRLVEDPEILGRPALVGAGEGRSWQHSHFLAGCDVVAVGSELEAGVHRERFADDPNPLDQTPFAVPGRYERQPRIAVGGAGSQLLALEKRRELFAFGIDVVAVSRRGQCKPSFSTLERTDDLGHPRASAERAVDPDSQRSLDRGRGVAGVVECPLELLVAGSDLVAET
jgi:hypothetical protein